MEKASSRDEARFLDLAGALERALAKHGSLYRRGVGEILINLDYYGHREIGVILLKVIDALNPIRAARECLKAVPQDREMSFTYDQSMGNLPTLVVSSSTIRHVSGE
jgi:hypothetical protein